MKPCDPGIVEGSRRRLLAAIKETGDVVPVTAHATTEALAAAVKDKDTVIAGSMLAEGVARGAVRAAIQKGANLGDAAMGIMVGVLRGTKTPEAEIIKMISQTAQVVIHDAAEADADLGGAATGLVQGAIHVAKEFGLSIEEAATAAADGALKAAQQHGATASDAVRSAVTRATHCVTVLLKNLEVVISESARAETKGSTGNGERKHIHAATAAGKI